jgi:acetyl-CoA carboxylase beta subunit
MQLAKFCNESRALVLNDILLSASAGVRAQETLFGLVHFFRIEI